jgi:hypothetical protein
MQSSEAMRFCSRCGFQLSAVTALLGNDGAPLAESPGDQPLYRRIFSRFGAKVIVLSVALFPVAFLISLAEDTPGPMMFPLALALVGFVLLAFSVIQCKVRALTRQETKQISPTAERSTLPPARFEPIPATGFRATDTAEIIQPPSVTESTTRLLARD